MQKARRHSNPERLPLRPLVGVWFQGLFTPLLEVLFTFPSQYYFTIGLSVVFSLTGWCRQIQTGFLRPRPTQDTVPVGLVTCTGLSPSSALFSKQLPLPSPPFMSVLLPQYNELYWFGLLRFRSPLLTESLLFSLPPGT